ncbi:hypothetical protein J2X31_000831 [Flavobacterium arsenatis]|uniref:DUF4932 domain-containing protein n=1 Tax=Flavobacterium arsenatis TaxID=1484332 RepID=A0ABU1TN39_9FLAO|nr:DUF4932 domain-containing protein [Flavobacterium arsenatis]MDR6966833.1 hypothetical protein [Flavobacterium arsenatis]
MNKLLFIGWILLTLNCYSQENIKIEITEGYELSNIILALTQYGKADKWDVQKVPPYYDEVLKYFEPLKNHPLLDSVNYSRPKWEKFLGFRTDMYAFSFDQKGKLKRDYPFNSFGPIEVDKNIDLINDFVVKSNYRQFYKNNKEFYDQIVSNYKEYYFVTKSKQFLEKVVEKPKMEVLKKYVIAISPLVGGQNCHRDIDSTTTVDFPNISKDLILGNLESNFTSRIVENHSLFTEMNHGYINPISDEYKKLIASNYNHTKWDKESGYSGINSFNEYMTWAVYDVFIKENFPKVADSIALQWQYQNASRGFIAQNLFAKKVSELYFNPKGDKKIKNIYKPLLEWCKTVENTITQPTLLNINTESFVKTDVSNLAVDFSEEMNIKNPFQIQIVEFKKGNQTGKEKIMEIKNAVWTNNGKKLTLKLDTDYEEFALIFNWWGIDKPLLSKNEILLKPQSYILAKK